MVGIRLSDRGGLFSGAFAVSFREGNPQSTALDSSLVQSWRICLAGHASFHGNHSNSFDLGGSPRWQDFGKNDGYMEHHPYPCVFFFGGGTPGSSFFVLNMILRTILLDCCSCDIFITAVILGFEEERWG